MVPTWAPLLSAAGSCPAQLQSAVYTPQLLLYLLPESLTIGSPKTRHLEGSMPETAQSLLIPVSGLP